MNIRRTLPPAAAPVHFGQLLHGLAGFMFGQRHLAILEEEMRAFFGIKKVFLVSSGKAALALTLSALKNICPTREEVIIPAYTCFSVPSAILKAGLKISLCDVNPTTFDFDQPSLMRLIKETTLCVIPSHLFGIPSDIEQINRYCKDRNVFVVEDAAQAMGGVYRGRKIGTIGDVGIFSLSRGKNITCGSGGIIVTNSELIGEEIGKLYLSLKAPGRRENLKEFFKVLILSLFIHPDLYWLPTCLPFLKLGETVFPKDFPVRKLSHVKAGLLNGWQNELEKLNNIRKQNAAFFLRKLKIPIQMDSPAPLLRLPYLFTGKEVKEQVYRLSRKQGLGLSPMYPVPICEIPEIHDQFKGQTYPAARNVATALLTIPTHNFLSQKDKESICALIENRVPRGS